MRRLSARSASLLRLALGDLAVVVAAAWAVAIPDLGDGGHVDGVVEACGCRGARAARPCAPPEDTSIGCGAVEGGEAVAGREAGDVAGDADDGGGHDRADPEDVDDGGARRGDHLLEPLLRLGELAVDAAQVVEQLVGELDAGGGDRAVGLDVGEQTRPLYLA